MAFTAGVGHVRPGVTVVFFATHIGAQMAKPVPGVVRVPVETAATSVVTALLRRLGAWRKVADLAGAAMEADAGQPESATSATPPPIRLPMGNVTSMKRTVKSVLPS